MFRPADNRKQAKETSSRHQTNIYHSFSSGDCQRKPLIMPDIQLIHGDSLQALKGYGDNHFDVAIVDPPYGINRGGQPETFTKNPKHKRREHKQKDWDKSRPNAEYWNELFRVSKNQIIWGANYFTEFLPPSMGWVFWDKGQNLTMSDGELAFTSFERALRRKIINRAEIMKDGAIHPTQKPVKLYRWLLKNYTKENDLILDTHLGSGSIAIACHYMNRNLIGYEIDKEYYDAACKRFKEQTKQISLF
jgi:site-specific DNA-methyltransferase (adenine-specific)